MARQQIYLECTSDGHYKFYEMTENGDGTFGVRYGAIGSPGTTTSYPMSKWNTKYNEKRRKGYVEKSCTQLPDAQTNGAAEAVQKVIDTVNRFGTKYGFTGLSKQVIIGKPVTLYQIISKMDFTAGDGTEVKKGACGGWIEQPGNLGQHDNSWVMDEAIVCGLACVSGDAVAKGQAKVCGQATVKHSAVVKDTAEICDRAIVEGDCVVYGTARISEDAHVSKGAWVNASVSGFVHITDGAWVDGGSYKGTEKITTDRC